MKKTEIMKFNLKKDNTLDIYILGNKVFNIDCSEKACEIEKEYVFSENIPPQAQMLLNLMLKGGKK